MSQETAHVHYKIYKPEKHKVHFVVLAQMY